MFDKRVDACRYPLAHSAVQVIDHFLAFLPGLYVSMDCKADSKAVLEGSSCFHDCLDSVPYSPRARMVRKHLFRETAIDSTALIINGIRVFFIELGLVTLRPNLPLDRFLLSLHGFRLGGSLGGRFSVSPLHLAGFHDRRFNLGGGFARLRLTRSSLVPLILLFTVAVFAGTRRQAVQLLDRGCV